MVVASAGSAFAQAVHASRAADAAEIRRQIEVICQAFVDKDRRTLTETHGKEWRGFTPYSDHVIRGLDGYMNEATFDSRSPKGQGMIGYKLSDFDVVFYGDTAVASFVLNSDVVFDVQKSVQKLTILDVFHKESAGWIQVASNTSLHPEQMMRRMSDTRGLGDDERKSLLAARESVWRAWFAGDADGLTKMLHAAGLSEDRIPGLRRHRHSLYGLRNGPHRRRQAPHRARHRHRSVRPPGGRPLGQYRLAARRTEPLASHITAVSRFGSPPLTTPPDKTLVEGH